MQAVIEGFIGSEGRKQENRGIIISVSAKDKNGKKMTVIFRACYIILFNN